MMFLSVLVVAAILVGLGVMVGSRIAGMWYDSQQSEIEAGLRIQLQVLRESHMANIAVLLVDAVDRRTRADRSDQE